MALQAVADMDFTTVAKPHDLDKAEATPLTVGIAETEGSSR
jgi:hypothetical protein